MTLARFALSPAGKMHAAACAQFGVDPAAYLEEVDDVLAYNLRVALVMSAQAEEPRDERRALEDRARDKGMAVRRMAEHG